MQRLPLLIILIALTFMQPLTAVRGQAQPKIRAVSIPDFPAYDLAVSPNSATAAVYFGSQGRILAGVGLAEYQVIPALTHILLIDLNTGEALRRIDGVGDYWSDVQFSPDGTRLAGYALNGDLYVWDSASGAQLQRITAVPGHHSIRFLGDNSTLLVLMGQGTPPSYFTVWTLDGGGVTRVLRAPLTSFGQIPLSSTMERWDYAYSAFDVSPDGTRIASTTGNSTVSPHSAADFTSETVRASTSADQARFHVRTVRFSQDGAHLIYTDDLSQEIVFWNIAENRGDFAVPTADQRPASLAFFPPTDLLVWPGSESLFALNLNDPQPITEIALLTEAESDVGLRFMRQRAPLHFLRDGELVVGGFFTSSDSAGSLLKIVTFP